MSNHLTDPIVQQMAREASKLALKRKKEMINKTGRARDRRLPGDCRNLQDSLASFCSECITGYGDDVGGAGSVFIAVELCKSKECHFWPWRNGKAHPEDVIGERGF